MSAFLMHQKEDLGRPDAVTFVVLTLFLIGIFWEGIKIVRLMQRIMSKAPNVGVMPTQRK
jgi:hypothetical protein